MEPFGLTTARLLLDQPTDADVDAIAGLGPRWLEAPRDDAVGVWRGQ